MTINGSDLMLFVESGNTFYSIAYATNHTLSVNMAQVDTSTKDNGNGYFANSEPGMISWEVTSENLMSDAAENGFSFNDLFQLFLKRETVKVVFALQKNSTNFADKMNEEFTAPADGWSPSDKNNYFGRAYITSLSVTATNGEKATMSVTLTGAGSLLMEGKGIQKDDVAKLSAKSTTPVATAK